MRTNKISMPIRQVAKLPPRQVVMLGQGLLYILHKDKEFLEVQHEKRKALSLLLAALALIALAIGLWLR